MDIRGWRYQGSGVNITVTLFMTSHSALFGMIRSSRKRWAEHVGHVGERRGTYRVLMGRPEGKRLVLRHRPRYKDNIGMD